MYKGERRAKYGNRKTVVDGMTFDSQKESVRYQELSLMQRKGLISGLRRQVKFELIPKFKGERAVSYFADFVYTDIENETVVVEDVKSKITAKDNTYILKRKLLKYRYPDIVFKEVF